MKASELRIGNFTHDSEYSVNVITHEDFMGVNNDVTLPLLPIPLTEEWLLKFGFWPKRKDAYYVSPCCDYAISLTTEEYGYFMNHSEVDGMLSWIRTNKIEYVHQLQNLYFALTGEELTISQ